MEIEVFAVKTREDCIMMIDKIISSIHEIKSDDLFVNKIRTPEISIQLYTFFEKKELIFNMMMNPVDFLEKDSEMLLKIYSLGKVIHEYYDNYDVKILPGNVKMWWRKKL
jgi:hypothetical protein